ncbi:MAG: hypothetical protein HRT71_12395 [Flavobacteriales bacterium]|nr:hypothetical protein [Flavobacteriales bacterium]
MKKLLIILGFAVFAVGCGENTTESNDDQKSEEKVEEAKAPWKIEDDTKTIESTCLAMLEAFSTPKGEKPDWARLNNLCSDSAIFNSVYADGGGEMHQYTLAEYEEEEGSWYDANDVLEEQLGITIDRFHNVANVFQAFKLTYDDHKGEAGTDQGVLFYQMAFVGDRWFITNLMWQSETGDSKVAEFVN